MNTSTWVVAAVGAVVAIIMIVLLVGADAHTETRWLVLDGAVLLWAMLVIAMVKLWHFRMLSATSIQKEILRSQAILLGG